jgi:hypothetical protein
MKVRKPKALFMFAEKYSIGKAYLFVKHLNEPNRPLLWELPALKRFHKWLGQAIAYLESKK